LDTVAAKLTQCAVPKLDPRLDAAARSTLSALGPMRRVCQQTFQQLPAHRSMTVTIQFDMSIDVVDEVTHPGVVMLRIKVRHEKSAEHLRYYVLAAVEESRQDLSGGA
jgi:hypothetical protein